MGNFIPTSWNHREDRYQPRLNDLHHNNICHCNKHHWTLKAKSNQTTVSFSVSVWSSVWGGEWKMWVCWSRFLLLCPSTERERERERYRERERDTSARRWSFHSGSRCCCGALWPPEHPSKHKFHCQTVRRATCWHWYCHRFSSLWGLKEQFGSYFGSFVHNSYQ